MYLFSSLVIAILISCVLDYLLGSFYGLVIAAPINIFLGMWGSRKQFEG